MKDLESSLIDVEINEDLHGLGCIENNILHLIMDVKYDMEMFLDNEMITNNLEKELYKYNKVIHKIYNIREGIIKKLG